MRAVFLRSWLVHCSPDNAVNANCACISLKGGALHAGEQVGAVITSGHLASTIAGQEGAHLGGEWQGVGFLGLGVDGWDMPGLADQVEVPPLGLAGFTDPRAVGQHQHRQSDRRGFVTVTGGPKRIPMARTVTPLTDPKAVLSVLPSVMQRLAIEPQSGALSTSGWSTVSEVLEWYTHRVAHDGNLSKNRKATARSAVKCQLLPCLGALRLVELNHATLDTKLMWPLQSQCSVAHVRLVFGVLKVAFKQAASLGLIGKNPMADMTFTDFIKTKIKPKDARLRPVDCGRLLEHFRRTIRIPKRIPKNETVQAHLKIYGHKKTGHMRRFYWVSD